LVLVAFSTSDQQQGPLLQHLCDALAGLDVEALVTTGPALDPASLSTADNVSAVEFVSHENVLPETDLLITHAGHGTVMAGVRYGVPMLCVPMGRDQPLVAARVAELGLGGTVEATANVDTFRQAIRRTLADRSMRTRCRAFAEPITAHAGIEQAIEVTEQLMGRLIE
jgi:MGT family glycosyltransferase